MSVLIECRAVNKRYGRKDAVVAATLSVEAGQRVGLVGESGSGKSTLGRMIVGLETPTAGQIVVDGVDLQSRLASAAGRRAYRRRVQLIAQDTSSSFDPRHTVRQSLLTPARLLGGLGKVDAEMAVSRIVDELGIDPSLLDRHPSALSGGQRQRMSIARALVVRPEVIVADEAVSALDVSVQGSVLNLLKRYCADNKAGLLFISHGLPATSFITTELVVMRSGRIVESGRTSEVLTSPRDSYTRELVAAYRGDEASITA